MRTVLFVCTGNTCRSPMAEAVARGVIERGEVQGGERLFVASAGIHAADGAPMSRHALQALRDAGIEHEGRSKRLTARMVQEATFVLCMTDSHVEEARRLVQADPAARARIVRFDPRGDIEDPVGCGLEAYSRLLHRFGELMPGRLSGMLTP